MLNRLFISLGILFGGLNLIWFACQSNGSDNRRNPVWGFLDGFVEIEKYVLYFALGSAVLAGLLYLMHLFIQSIPKEKSEIELMIEARLKRNAEDDERKAILEKKYQDGLELMRAEARATQTNSNEPQEKTKRQAIIVPQKINPSPEAPKQKAIQDILRR